MNWKRCKLISHLLQFNFRITELHRDAVQVRGVGNWILVKCFVGEMKVQLNDGHNADNQRWTVRFLKRIDRSGSNFCDSLSPNQATDDIDDDDVVTILSCPCVVLFVAFTLLCSTSVRTSWNNA